MVKELLYLARVMLSSLDYPEVKNSCVFGQLSNSRSVYFVVLTLQLKD